MSRIGAHELILVEPPYLQNPKLDNVLIVLSAFVPGT